jgi:hypothetical protein
MRPELKAAHDRLHAAQAAWQAACDDNERAYASRWDRANRPSLEQLHAIGERLKVTGPDYTAALNAYLDELRRG